MTMTSPSRMQVVRKEEKELRLQEFIRHELTAMGNMAAGARCMLLARSPESPVARALATFSAALDDNAIAPRVIFSMPGGSDASRPADLDWLQRCTVRFARHPQLVDAHEILIIGTQASWVGDSMRRDPAKRDAYESHTHACNIAADHMARSFEQLWQRSETSGPAPTRSASAIPKAGEQEAAAENHLTPAPVEALQPPTPGATRH